MYKLRLFKKYLCNHIDYDRRICKKYSIWGLNSVPYGRSIQSFIDSVSPCTYEIFPLIYWTVFCVGIVGTICCVYEFLTIYHGNKCLSTFRSRRFYVLPGVFRRNSRLIGAAFMAKFYILMLLGVVMMHPPFLLPYLTVQGVSLGMDLILWGLDLIMDDEFLSGSTFVSYFVFIVAWLFVHCIKSVFEEAIQNGDTKNLALIKV